MDVELVKAWIAALRSGEYKQAKSVLADGNGGYCCLGVACAVASGKGTKATDAEIEKVAGGSNWRIASTSLRERLGLSNHSSGYIGSGVLMRMNDEDKRTFADIADYIEEFFKLKEEASV